MQMLGIESRVSLTLITKTPPTSLSDGAAMVLMMTAVMRDSNEAYRPHFTLLLHYLFKVAQVVKVWNRWIDFFLGG